MVMIWHRDDELILASASPRRAELLRQIGVPFRRVVSGVDEDLQDPADPKEHVRVLSRRKAEDVAGRFNSGIVLGADTIVVLDEHILGKPADAREAQEMLAMLSGRTHQVYTGLTLVDAARGVSVSHVEVTEVTFRQLTGQEIAAYVATGEPLDKAGAYGIQGKGALLVRGIRGCYFNVVGLPLAGLMSALRRLEGGLGSESIDLSKSR
jgi:septum formation protein